MAPSQAFKSSLVTFGRHTPRALRHQILCQLALQYLGISDGVDAATTHNHEEPRSSLHRFHGALLFVDISGFTALSLRLKVEELKNHINDYFTTMLNIVDRWDGDVIKFAGDALYVVWKTELAAIDSDGDDGHMGKLPGLRHYSKDFLDTSHGTSAVKNALEKATACGLEISSTCCNHEVQLDSPAVDTAPAAGYLSGLIPKWGRNTISKAESQNNVAYLNVHAGVSYGLMGGVDIGAHDRWEYFLIGDPVHRVAEAEEQAAKGDVVVCIDSHALLHGSRPDCGSCADASPGTELPCGCIVTPIGFFKITKLDARSPRAKPARMKKTRSKARLDEQSTVVTDVALNMRIFDDSSMEVEKLFASLQGILKAEVVAFVNRSDLMTRAQQKLANTGGSSPPAASSPNVKTKEKLILDIMHNDLRKHLTSWFQQCLLEDFVKHVHEVARDDFYYEPKPRSTAFRMFLEQTYKYKTTGEAVPRPSRATRGSVVGDGEEDSEQMPSRAGPGPGPGMLRAAKNRNPSLNGAQFTALVKKASSKYLAQDTALSAEIRNVMVMFIKIVGLQMDLEVDRAGDGQHGSMGFSHLSSSSRMLAGHGPLRASGGGGSMRMAQSSSAARAVTRGQSIGAVFDLLDRTANEMDADTSMLNRAQQCMEVLCQVFTETGGQMRQFIVDDKGTVCIGTFGLKGSVGIDNAATALETAKSIVIRLHSLDLVASIGITSGKAYCGLVGSPQRHEYAVMGPSTNLSARLMCKAPPYGVICDIETKNRDRTHGFEPLTEVQAKGYVLPVMTYKPIFDDSLHLLVGRDSDLYDALSPSRANTRGRTQSQANLRASSDFYLPSLNRSASAQWRSDRFEPAIIVGSPRVASSRSSGLDDQAAESSPHTPSIDLTGRQASLRRQKSNVAASAPANTVQSVFKKRRKSLRDIGMIKEELLKMSTSKLRLRGREIEEREILSFLFPNILEHITAGRSFSIAMSGSFSGSRPPPLMRNSSGMSVAEYDMDSPARIVVIAGGEGTGKSALVDAVANKVFIAAKLSPNFSVYTFKNRPSSLDMNVPFHSVKPIIQDILARVDNSISKSQNGSMVSNGKPNRRIKMSVRESIASGVKILFPFLPTEMQNWRPLLHSAAIVLGDADNDVTAAFTDAERTQHTVELLAAMIGAFPKIVRSSVLLVIEELQSLDPQSRQVLFEVWRSCSGVLVLCTQRTLPTVSITSLDQSINDGESTRNTLRHTMTVLGGAGLSTTDGAELYGDTSVFKLIDLRPLSMDATKELILDVIPENLRPRIDEVLVGKLCESSGGHPLYAYEITRNLVDKLSADTTNEDINLILADLGVGVASNRIEEMICYRFDQLESPNQMILKAAAVACSNGAPFTLEMLIFILLDNDDSAAEVAGADDGAVVSMLERGSSKFFPASAFPGSGGAVGGGSFKASHTEEHMSGEGAREVLEAILSRGEFIHISRPPVATGAGSAPDAVIDRGAGMWSPGGDTPVLTLTTKMEFKIVLEQITIYSLLVDDQREFLHERVACYYRQQHLQLCRTADRLLFLGSLREAAYHWQHGSNYVEAMKAHYTLAQLLSEDGDRVQHNAALHTAYSMFMSLKQEHGVARYSLCSLRELEEALHKSTHDASAPHVIGDDASYSSELPASPWTMEVLYSMFNGELADLRMALEVQHALVLSELLSFEHPRFVLPVAEECLHMMLVVRQQHILASSVVFGALLAMTTSQSRMERDVNVSVRVSSRNKSKAVTFFLEDFNVYCAPLMTAYVLAGSWVESRFAPKDEIFQGDATRGKSRAVQQELRRMVETVADEAEEADEIGFGEDDRTTSEQLRRRVPFVRAQVHLLRALLALGEDKVSSAVDALNKAEAERERGLAQAPPSPPSPNLCAQVEAYLGVDLTGHTQALVAQRLLLRGEVAVAGQLLHRASLFLETAALGSVALALPPLVAALQVLRDYPEALRALDVYEGRFCPPERTALSPALRASLVSIDGTDVSATSTPTHRTIHTHNAPGLRLHFVQKLRVWLMCDRNQNSAALELPQRLRAFSQLTSSLQEEVVREIVRPLGQDGSFWPDFLAQCGLSLPAVTAMVFCCHQVMVQGARLRLDGELEAALRDYAAHAGTGGEYGVLDGHAPALSKIYFYHSNLKVASILSAVGMDVTAVLAPKHLAHTLLDAARALSALGQPLGSALVAGLAQRAARGPSSVRGQALAVHRAAVDAAAAVDPTLEVRRGDQLWLLERRLV